MGSTFHDLREVTSIELNEPRGWVSIPLCKEGDENESAGTRAHFVQAVILSMHQNGKVCLYYIHVYDIYSY